MVGKFIFDSNGPIATKWERRAIILKEDISGKIGKHRYMLRWLVCALEAATLLGMELRINLLLRIVFFEKVSKACR